MRSFGRETTRYNQSMPTEPNASWMSPRTNHLLSRSITAPTIALQAWPRPLPLIAYWPGCGENRASSIRLSIRLIAVRSSSILVTIRWPPDGLGTSFLVTASEHGRHGSTRRASDRTASYSISEAPDRRFSASCAKQLLTACFSEYRCSRSSRLRADALCSHLNFLRSSSRHRVGSMVTLGLDPRVHGPARRSVASVGMQISRVQSRG